MSFTRAKTSRDKIYKDKKNLRFDSANVANQSVSPREEKSNAVASIKQIGLTKLRFVPRNDKKLNIFAGTVRPEGFLISVREIQNYSLNLYL
jgi:hypothetical protein